MSLAKRIIPCLDVDNGRVVKGVKFVDIRDAGDPVEAYALADLINKWSGFGRGDVNNDGGINLADIIYLAGTVNGGPGSVPFEHLSDVNADSAIDVADVNYLIDYYFNCGPCPMGDFIF